MAIVVTEKCRDCRFTECVTVCPVACFHGDSRMLYIDPVACILCQACVPVCPEQAIYDEVDLPPEWGHWVGLNAERAPKLPVIDEKQTPMKASA